MTAQQQEAVMAVRERSAWISLVAVALPFAAYFLFAATHPDDHAQQHVMALVGAVLATVVLQVVLHAVAALLSPREPAVPADERERLIELRATRAAFYALTTAALLAIFTIHLGAHTVMLANLVFAAVVLGELVRSGVIVFGYRRW